MFDYQRVHVTIGIRMIHEFLIVQKKMYSHGYIMMGKDGSTIVETLMVRCNFIHWDTSPIIHSDHMQYLLPMVVVLSQIRKGCDPPLRGKAADGLHKFL